jgi:hypothetical protein
LAIFTLAQAASINARKRKTSTSRDLARACVRGGELGAAAAHERHVVVVLILIDQLVSPLFVSRSQFIWRKVFDD